MCIRDRIELLVVVAIIGILAAVGTVAYTGYTKSAKKNAAGSNHAAVVKYVAAELQKCNLETEAFKTSAGATMTCTNKSKTDATGPTKAAADALLDFKDPYGETSPAIIGQLGATHTASTVKGTTVISTDGTTLQVSTCVSVCTGTDSDVKMNEVGIE